METTITYSLPKNLFGFHLPYLGREPSAPELIDVYTMLMITNPTLKVLSRTIFSGCGLINMSTPHCLDAMILHETIRKWMILKMF